MNSPVRELLIVEDDAEIRLFLKTSLVADSFAVFTATGGREALQLSMHRSFALIVLDLGLPDMDGVEVIKAIRGRKSTVPILLLSRSAHELPKLEARDALVNGCITKPFGIGEFPA